MLRTFVAIELSQPIRTKTARLIKKFPTAGESLKWVKPETLHLTLNFLGDVDERQVHEICLAVGRQAAKHEPFEMECYGLGAFPDFDHRLRAVWIGVDLGGEPLCQLQQEIEQSLSEIGFPGEARKFQPHITIARQVRNRGTNADLLEQLKLNTDFDAGTMLVTQVTVLSSQLEHGGPVYGVLSKAPLGG